MKAFVIMPFHDKLPSDVYTQCVKPVCRTLEIEVNRADEILSPNPILEDVIDAIEKSNIIIADISGRNPNEMYSGIGATTLSPSHPKNIIQGEKGDCAVTIPASMPGICGSGILANHGFSECWLIKLF